MLPPRPPSPPSGPPRGMYFSRLKLTAPFPPFPAWTSILVSSMNFMGVTAVSGAQNKKPYREDRAFFSSASLCRNDVHGIPVVRTLDVELDFARDLRKQSVIPADADVLARVNPRAALSHENASRRNDLPTEAFDAEALGLRVATVSGASARFLVCHGACSLTCLS